jgi:hypothetical protein
MSIAKKIVYGRAEPGSICYVPRVTIVTLCKKSPIARIWTYGGKIRSAIIGTMHLKALENFSERIPMSEEGINLIVEDATKLGAKPPASWSSIWGDVIQPSLPRCRKSINLTFGQYFSGGWNAKLTDHSAPGSSTYDLVSAYCWAGYRYVPIPSSAVRTNDLSGDGIYIITGTLASGVHYPRPWKAGRNTMMVTLPEIELYDIKDVRVKWGVRFCRMVDLRPHIDKIMNMCHFSKNILRAYWGRWAARAGVECSVQHNGAEIKKWSLPPVSQNFLWAHLITSRVRARVWEFVKQNGGSHVFTDAVITDRRIQEGFKMGEWRKKETHSGRLFILGAGRIKDESGQWVKHSGVSL